MYNKWTVCLPWRSACAFSNTLHLPGDVSSDASLAGIAVRLDRPLDDTTRQQLIDAVNTMASFSGQLEGNQAMSGEELERSLAMMTYTQALCLLDASTISDGYYSASESLISLVSIATEETLTSDGTILPLSPLSLTVQNHFNFYGSGATVQVGGDRNSGC